MRNLCSSELTHFQGTELLYELVDIASIFQGLLIF